MRLPLERTKYASHLDVVVVYSKGGMNYTSHKEEPRGIWLSFIPVMVEDNGMVSYTFVFDGCRRFVEAASRHNPKRVQAVFADVQESIAGQSGEYWNKLQTFLTTNKLKLVEPATV